jgi:hypothetical protein
MEDKHLDRIFREKLDQLAAPFDADSWELLEQRMDGEVFGDSTANDQQIDEKVFGKLHRLEADYSPAHWSLMSSLLDQEFFLHRKVIRYKAMELALLFLIVFALAQYLPYAPKNTAPTPVQAQIENPDLPKKDITTDVVAENSAADTDVNAISDNSSAPSSIPNNSIANNTPSVSNTTTDEETAAKNLVEDATEIPTLAILTPLGTLPAQSLARRVESGAYLRTILHRPIPINAYFKNSTGLLASLNKKAINPLEYELEKLHVQQNKKKNHTRIGMFNSIDYNRVLTPPSDAEGINGFERYALGYGGGISVGFEFGRLELESGFIYSAKQYKPVPVLFVQGSVRDGFFAEGVKDIELNMINIPLNLRYNFYVKNKLRLYALTGLSLQMAYQANYYTANQDGFRTNTFLPAPAPAAPPEGTPEILDNSRLKKGLFEGGSFSENSYLTGNFGIGMDYYFTSRWSLFAQPTYQHSINYFIDGIGPLHDRINTFSIFTGIKVKL